jgi:predicted dehydrogenase
MQVPVPEPLGVAVVGAGLGSAPHFSSLADLSDQAQVLWVCTRNPARLTQVPMPAGAQKTTCLDDVLHDPRVRAVLVLTPPNTHLDIVQKLAMAGKHVLVEKPLDISLLRATALVQTCEAHGVKLAVMLQHRLRDAAVALQMLLAAGELGQIVSATAAVRWWRAQSYYDEPGRGTLARDGGGVLMTQAIHTLDLLIHLIGVPVRVTGLATTSPVHQLECEDTAAALLHYDSGAVAVLQATTAAYPGFPERIELNGTRGSATLEAGELQVHYTDGRAFAAGARQAMGAGANPMAFDHGAHRAVLQDFIRAVQTGQDPAVGGRSALAVQAVIEAVMQSAHQGAAVTLQHPA